jgi:hypothetical protein
VYYNTWYSEPRKLFCCSGLGEFCDFSKLFGREIWGKITKIEKVVDGMKY